MKMRTCIVLFVAVALGLSFCQLASGLGIITTFAGTSRGFSGDGGPATSAQLALPIGVAFDGSGNLFISDNLNHRIRKVDTNGIITTFAGTGVPGFSGDGGPATSAQLNRPQGVAVDAVGNLFIAERINNRIRKVDTNGIITTVAGTSFGFSGDGGPATSAQLASPDGVAFDGAGNLFIADTSNARIRKVDTSGIITTVAGNGVLGFSGDGGPATSAQLDRPAGVAFDGSGNFFIADLFNHRIRKVDTSGIITTVAGSGATGFGNGGFSGDGGPATSARLSRPWGVAFDGAGNLLIVDFDNDRIRKVDTNGIITTVAGTGVSVFGLGDGGPAISAQLSAPRDVAFDGAGNLFIADWNLDRIRKVFPDTTPPTADTITHTTTGPTNATSVDFTVTFSENVVNFSIFSALVVITHIGTANTGVIITGGPQTYTVSVTGITGDGAFRLAVSTDLDIEDLCGNPLAGSVTSAPVFIDNTAPAVEIDGLITDNPSPQLSGTVNEATASISVTVDGQTNLAVNNNDTTWTLPGNTLTALPVGIYDVSVTATDLAGNVGTDGTVDELAVIVSSDPRLSITTNIALGSIEEGDHLILLAPAGSNYQWAKDHLDLSDDPPRLIGSNTQILLFDPVLESDAGTYTVFFDDGTRAIVESEPFVLTVLAFGSLPAARAGALAILMFSLVVVGVVVRYRTAIIQKDDSRLL